MEMRIAIPSISDEGLESEVSGHFGRSPYYTFVDIEEGEIKNVESAPVPYEDHGPGDLPNFVKEHGGEVVIAYGMGHKAVDFFQQFGIEVVTGAEGKIKDVIEAFIHNLLKVDPYWKEKIEKEKKHKD
jgi:predicted Fe-Mo cluster-binding NifX family protein